MSTTVSRRIVIEPNYGLEVEVSTPDSDGEIRLCITDDDGDGRITYLTPDEARHLANTLLSVVEEAP